MAVWPEVALAALGCVDEHGAVPAAPVPSQPVGLIRASVDPFLWFCPWRALRTTETASTVPHEFHGEEAVAASPQAGVRQQAVNAIGDAPVELQLPLHDLALSVIQEKGANLRVISTANGKVGALQGLQ